MSISDPIEKILHIESTNLRKKCAVFYEGCSSDDRLDLRSSEPTIEGVVEVVGRIQDSWQRQRENSNRGKASRMFRSFCRGINSHKSLLKLLPEGNEYISVFTGTLNVVLKVAHSGRTCSNFLQ